MPMVRLKISDSLLSEAAQNRIRALERENRRLEREVARLKDQLDDHSRVRGALDILRQAIFEARMILGDKE